jgi:integrase
MVGSFLPGMGVNIASDVPSRVHPSSCFIEVAPAPIASHSTLKASLLRVAPPILRDVVVLGVNTGVRVASELLTLTWADVDFQRNQLTVQAGFAKADETRSVPLNSRAREVLLRRKAPSRIAFLFSKPNCLPYRSADKLLATACQGQGWAERGSRCIRSDIPSPAALSCPEPIYGRSGQGAGAT